MLGHDIALGYVVRDDGIGAVEEHIAAIALIPLDRADTIGCTSIDAKPDTSSIRPGRRLAVYVLDFSIDPAIADAIQDVNAARPENALAAITHVKLVVEQAVGHV